jgi:hypothetical protein
MAKELTPKEITDITIHSDFIPALQSIMLYYIDQQYPNKADVAVTLGKFNKMLDGNLGEEKVNLEWYEYHTFIFYSLLQILGNKANEQGLYQESNVVMNEEILGKLTKSILNNDTASQSELYQEFFNDIQAQQDDKKSS